jgi:DNA-binding response OmpR family regulator
MLFQDRYNVITTTNLGLLEKFVGTYSADLVIIDAIPSEKVLERLEGLGGVKSDLPIIMLYVYNSRETQLDTAIRKHVDSVFYKPFEIDSVSDRIGTLLKD